MIVINLGLPGTGKTRLSRQLAAGRLRRWPTCSVLVHDPAEQWRGGRAFNRADDVRAYIERTGKRPRLIRVRFDTASAVCKLAWDLGCITLVLDEMDTLCTNKAWSGEDEVPEFSCGAGRAIVHYGRHRNVDLIGSFRSTRGVNEDIPGFARFIFVFRHDDKGMADVDLLRRRFGDDFAEAAVRLDDHECLVVKGGGT